MDSGLEALLRLSVESPPPPPPPPPPCVPRDVADADDAAAREEEEAAEDRAWERSEAEERVDTMFGGAARRSFAAAWDAESNASEPPPPPATEPLEDGRRSSAARASYDRKRVDQLATSRLEEFEARESARRVLEDLRVASTCTFKPTLATARGHAQTKPKEDVAAMTRRLHGEAHERWEMRELRRIAVEETQVASCRFEPELVAGLSSSSSSFEAKTAPLHRRVADVERAREGRLRELRDEVERSTEPSFTPQINEDPRSLTMAKRAAARARSKVAAAAAQSAALSASKNDDCANTSPPTQQQQQQQPPPPPPDVAARLAADAWHRSMVEKDRAEAYLAAARACQAAAVAPKLSRGSARIAARKTSIGATPFAERERRRQEDRDARRRADESDRDAERDRLFRPRLSDRSIKLDRKRTSAADKEESSGAAVAGGDGGGGGLRHHLREAAQPPAAPAPTASRLDRLSRDARRVEEKRAAKQAEQFAQFTFKPTLEASAMKGRPHQRARAATVDDLSKNVRGEEQRKRLEEEAAERERSQCTFKPKLATKPAMLFKVKTEAERRALRERKMEADRKQRELDELRECSFRPATNSNSKIREQSAALSGQMTAVKPVVVRGLSRHLELKKRAAALEQDHRSREYAAFNVERAEQWRQGQKYTTPIPFALSGVS